MNVEFLAELIEHKVAPTPLIAVQGLIDTQDHETDMELLGDPEATREWLLGAGLLDEGSKVSEQDHRDLLDLRRTLRSLLVAQAHGERDGQAIAELRRLSYEHLTGYDVSDEGVVALCVKPVENVSELIGQLIGIVGQAQDLDQWRRLKICASDECLWAFYDSSKNRSGSWCRMEVCGNRTKNRRYRSHA